MAKINQNIPEVPAPIYFGYSQPISQPKGDKSLGTLFAGIGFAGIGNVIKEGTQIVDTAIKSSIDTAVNAGVDTTREIYTAGLESIAGRPSPSLLGEDTTTNATNAPSEVQSVGNVVGTMRSAVDAGKLSPTAYYGKLTAIAKQLRSQYPGYRDFIDQQISQASGVNPANAYMKSIMSDISSASTNSNTESNKVQTLLFKYAPDLIPQWKAGKLDNNQAVISASQRAAMDVELTRREALRKDMSGTRDDQAVQSADDANTIAAYKVHNFLDNVTVDAGLENPTTASKLLEMYSTGNFPKLSDASAQTLTMQLTALRATAARQLYDSFTKPGDNGSPPIMNRLKGGVDEANKIANNNLQTFDNLLNLVSSKDTGAAYYHARRVKALVADSQSNLLEDKNVGAYWSLVGGVAALGPQVSTELIKSALNANIDEKMKNYYQEQLSKITTQAVPKQDSTGNYQLTPTVAPITIKGLIQDGISKGVKAPALYNSYIDYITNITSPQFSDQAKLNLVKAAFSPQNVGVLSLINNDVVDPTTGRKSPGKLNVFHRLTSPQMTQEVKRLSDKYDPAIWNQYKGLAETEFGRELFGQEIRRLNSIQNTDNFALTYNTDTHQFKLNVLRNPHELSFDINLKQSQEALNNINIGLSSIVNIAKTEGGDADAYMLGLLQQAGWKPGANVKGLPQKMIDALTHAHNIDLTKSVIGNNTFNTKTNKKTSERIPPNLPIVSPIVTDRSQEAAGGN